MKVKTSIAMLFISFAFAALSNKAFSQTTVLETPQSQTQLEIHTLPRAFQDKSSELPGITSTKTLIITGAAIVVVTVGIILILHNEKKHHAANNTRLNSRSDQNFNFCYNNTPFNTTSGPNFNVCLVFNNNEKGVGVRYAF
jgi:hypothetical protein